MQNEYIFVAQIGSEAIGLFSHYTHGSTVVPLAQSSVFVAANRIEPVGNVSANDSRLTPR